MDIALPAHKVSLVIQSVLGGVELPVNENTAKYRPQYNTDVAIIFQHVHRLIRCIIDCQLYLEDSIASRNALTLARSLGARVWDDSPLQLKQVEQIGIVAVRKLVNAGIKTIEELENTEPHRIETILSKHPPFGMRLLDRLKAFPKLHVSVKTMGQPVRFHWPVTWFLVVDVNVSRLLELERESRSTSKPRSDSSTTNLP